MQWPRHVFSLRRCHIHGEQNNGVYKAIRASHRHTVFGRHWCLLRVGTTILGGLNLTKRSTKCTKARYSKRSSMLVNTVITILQHFLSSCILAVAEHRSFKHTYYFGTIKKNPTTNLSRVPLFIQRLISHPMISDDWCTKIPFEYLDPYNYMDAIWKHCLLYTSFKYEEAIRVVV